MGLVAGVAGLFARVLLRIDLREALRLGDIFGVAADGEVSDVRLLRSESGGVARVLGERTVTRFAVDMRMDAFCLGFGNVRMARLAGLVTSVSDGAGTKLGERVAAIVAINPKALWQEDA